MAPIEADRAERLLLNALGGTPELSSAQIDDLLIIAQDEDGSYPVEGLNAAASLGWSWKMALQSDQYDLGGGPGRTLARSQWFEYCARMQAGYSSGQLSVTGGAVRSERRTQMGSIGLVSSGIPAEDLP